MLALALNLITALFMTGLVWHEQIVSLPLLQEVGRKQFKFFMRDHILRTSYLSIPTMILEALFALWLAIATPSTQAGLALLVIAAIWVVSVMIHVPDYRKIASDKDKKAINLIIRNNLLRSGLWTVRALLLLSLLWHEATVSHW